MRVAESLVRANVAVEADREEAARFICTADPCHEPTCLSKRIRALAPAGLVAVDPADLEMVLPLAEGGPADYQQPSAWRDAHRRIRAAVARKGG